MNIHEEIYGNGDIITDDFIFEATMELHSLLEEKYGTKPNTPPFDCVVDEFGNLLGCKNVSIKIPKIKRPKKEKQIKTTYEIKKEEWIRQHSFCRICDNERIVCGGENNCKFKK